MPPRRRWYEAHVRIPFAIQPDAATVMQRLGAFSFSDMVRLLISREARAIRDRK